MPIALFVLMLAASDAAPLPPIAPAGVAPAPSAPPRGAQAPDLGMWAAQPSIEAMTTAYPAEARARGIGGRAMIDCAILPSGQVTDCKIAQELPEGQGFGAAALSLTPLFALKDETRTSAKFAGGRTLIPMVWRVRDCPAPWPGIVGERPPTAETVSSWGARFNVIRKPNWLRRPNGDDIRSFYPDRAARNGISGRVTITCQVTGKGTLTKCSVVTESPVGEDFGAASLALASKFKMSVMTADCDPVEGGTVRIPLNWSPLE